MGLGVAREEERGREPLIGRTDEVRLLEQALDELAQGRPTALELLGEPGIGKTRLLRELTARAEERDFLVLAGSASDLERDLPFSAFVHALDEYVESLDRDSLLRLDGDVQAELAQVFPSLSFLAGGRQIALQHERYRSHRAVRALLELLAERTPLVLILDDFHWADSASVELLGGLLRRPPSGAVLLVLALRPRPPSERLVAALDGAHRSELLLRIELRNLSAEECQELLGETITSADASNLYEESGGNPFYLEQLARSLDHPDGHAASMAPVAGVPDTVLVSLSQELSLLSPAGRLLVDGAAVAGDPFEPELAATAAATSETEAMEALDELLQLDLVRTTDVPRRFRFRHPLVRRAIYESTAAAWRLGAHQRCADYLALRGASAVSRAPHVELAAREGDLEAVAVLRTAGEEAFRLAPASSARWFADALRLLPATTPPEERTGLLLSRAQALMADGHFAEGHEMLFEALASVPSGSSDLRVQLTAACARVEHLLGRYADAGARLHRELDGLSEPVSPEAASLMIELALENLLLTQYATAREWAGQALEITSSLEEQSLQASALAMVALADAMCGAGEQAEAGASKAAEVTDALADDELAAGLDAAVWLAAAEFYSDRYAQSEAHIERALAVARATGQGELLLFFLYLQGRVLYMRAKLTAAAQLIDAAIEAARLLGNREVLAWSLYNRSAVALACGDLDSALADAEESIELTREVQDSYVTAWAGARLAAILFERGQTAPAADLLTRSAGGEDLPLIPAGWRPYCLELLARCHLELGQQTVAAGYAERAEECAAAVALPMSQVWAARATAVVALHDGDGARAAERALKAAVIAEKAGAPIEAALARTLAGRALAQMGQKAEAISELQAAATELDACGAIRYRDAAERELGKLGQRRHRRSQPGKANGRGVETLTARELQVAQLVVDRKTNPQIAAELFLSNKTVETHLRNIFRKLDVTSRVELARAVERAAADAPSLT